MSRRILFSKSEWNIIEEGSLEEIEALELELEEDSEKEEILRIYISQLKLSSHRLILVIHLYTIFFHLRRIETIECL